MGVHERRDRTRKAFHAARVVTKTIVSGCIGLNAIPIAGQDDRDRRRTGISKLLDKKLVQQPEYCNDTCITGIQDLNE